MGGGDDSSSTTSSSATDDHSSLECLDDDDSHRRSDGLGFELEDEAVNVNPSGFDSREFDQTGNDRNSPNHARFHENWSWQLSQEARITNSYTDSQARIESLRVSKRTLLSYSPGSWIDKEEGETLSEFDVPKTTTLLLVGLKQSGKSSLINRISRVFEDGELASDRAQVSYSSALGDGTYFLQRYMFPRRSSSFCLFDSRSLSTQVYDNEDMMRSWMKKGVRSGELVIRGSDYLAKSSLECKIRDGGILAEPIRKVNFVIFVVDGLSVLTYMSSDKEEDKQRAKMLARTYNFPYLSFRDDKPVIVVTHGDLLSLEQRTKVRIYLGELLGVSPTTQTFDIPESRDPITELAIVDMLRYALERADKNLPRKSWTHKKLSTAKSALGQVFKRYFIVVIFLVLALGMNVFPLGHHASWLKSPADPQQQQRYYHEPLVNSTTQPTSSEDHHRDEHPASARDTNQPDNLEDTSSATQPNSSHSASKQPNDELHRPSMQSTPIPKATEEPRKSSVRSKHKLRDRPPKSSKKNRSRKQRKPAVLGPGISWEARQRLWLAEEPDSRDHPPESPKNNRSHKQHGATVSEEPGMSWEARQRLWLAEE